MGTKLRYEHYSSAHLHNLSFEKRVNNLPEVLNMVIPL